MRGRGSPPACIPQKSSSPITGSSHPALSHSAPGVLVQLLVTVAGTEASCPGGIPVSPAGQLLLCYCKAGGETRRKAPHGNMCEKQPERMLESLVGWGLLTQPGLAYPQLAPSLPSSG